MTRVWRRVGRPSREDWAEFLRRHGGFVAFGEANNVDPSAFFNVPSLISIGSNVWVTGGVHLFNHDGSVGMLNPMSGKGLDAVGPIRIGNDVFIGQGTIIAPGTVIGDRTIIGAGSVVGGTLEGDAVYAGNRAVKLRSMDEHLARIEKRADAMPWISLVRQREEKGDTSVEPRIRAMRRAFYFGDIA